MLKKNKWKLTGLPINSWLQSQCYLSLSRNQTTFPYHASFSPFQKYKFTYSSNAEEAEVGRFYEDLQDFLEFIPKKRCLFQHRGLECKSRKSKNTWNNRQVWPWSTKWSRAKANRVLPRGFTGHSKHSLPTTQEMTLHVDITRWSITKIRLIIFFAAEDGEVLNNQQKQDLELTMVQIISSI